MRIIYLCVAGYAGLISFICAIIRSKSARCRAFFSSISSLYFIINKFCNHFKLDFGALDVMRNDNNQFYIIDVNTTPYWGVKLHPEPELFKFLAGAL